MQVVILKFLPNMRGSSSLKILKLLNSLIVLQYLTRVYPIFIFCREVNANNFLSTSSDRKIVKIRTTVEWNRILIAFNFLWYLLASHVCYYLTTIYFNRAINYFIIFLSKKKLLYFIVELRFKHKHMLHAKL